MASPAHTIKPITDFITTELAFDSVQLQVCDTAEFVQRLFPVSDEAANKAIRNFGGGTKAEIGPGTDGLERTHVDAFQRIALARRPDADADELRSWKVVGAGKPPPKDLDADADTVKCRPDIVSVLHTKEIQGQRKSNTLEQLQFLDDPMNIWWTRVETPVVVRTSSSKATQEEGLSQLVRCLRQVLRAQPNRMFAFGLLIVEHKLHVVLSDRASEAGVLVTRQPIWMDGSVEKDSENTRLLFKTILGLSDPAHAEDLGWDSTMRLRLHSQCPSPHTLSFANPVDNTVSIRDFGKDIHDSSTSWAIFVPDSHYGTPDQEGGSWYMTIKQLSSTGDEGMVGRATIVWSVIELQADLSKLVSPQDGKSPQILVLKQSWERIGRPTEHDICPEPTDFVGKIIRSARIVSAAAASTARDAEHRVLTRTLLGTFGWPLSRFVDLRELVTALRDAIEGHRNLYFDCGVIHKDISITNILICPDLDRPKPLENIRGCLIDLDHAKRSKQKLLVRTGTYPIPGHPDGPEDVETINAIKAMEFWVEARTPKIAGPEGILNTELRYIAVTVNDKPAALPSWIADRRLLEALYWRFPFDVPDIPQFIEGFLTQNGIGDESKQKLWSFLGGESQANIYKLKERSIFFQKSANQRFLPPDWNIVKAFNDSRSGTMRFMSGECLGRQYRVSEWNQVPVLPRVRRVGIHSAIHDMEAFFWVLLYLCLTYEGPGKRVQEPDPDTKNLLRDTFETRDTARLAQEKAAFFTKPNGAAKMDDCLRHIQGHFKPLTGLLKEWWAALFDSYYVYDSIEDAGIHRKILDVIERFISANPEWGANSDGAQDLLADRDSDLAGFRAWLDTARDLPQTHSRTPPLQAHGNTTRRDYTRSTSQDDVQTKRQKLEGSQGEGSSSHAPKKTRFVEPSEDPVNFAEEVDAQLENPSGRRKGKVNTAGYDSDSSDDGEGVVLSRRPQAAEEDEEDDMFATGDKEDTKGNEDGDGKKKKQEFMRLGDIEGQEFGDGDGEDGSEEEDDEPEDEDDAERRKKAGMGFELSSFNMREEMEEGKFAADGTYVKAFDPHAVHDRWMEGMDEREIKRARRQHRHQEKAQREKIKAEERELEEFGSKENVEMRLLGMLKKGETVLEALHRLGVKAKKNAPAKKKPNSRSKANGEAMVVDKEPVAQPKSEIDEITHLASLLMSFGDVDIYNKTYEELVRSVRAAGKVDQTWDPPSADVRYEYAWDVPGAATNGQDGQVFGPYSEDEMLTWFKAAYFGSAGEKVKVRTVGSSQWGTWDDVVT
ncbi:hypothetical protein EIP91_005166 [Steccherinum ochraceum]|uniref:GYF domain-containing protein n=1 Tax=Steccherinum ochraceum TaxID=92696 RepID=A0A4R0RDM2_9APHY|nr:hypothetical protein EIP91_005166 [Steccherinum ochraceum]